MTKNQSKMTEISFFPLCNVLQIHGSLSQYKNRGLRWMKTVKSLFIVKQFAQQYIWIIVCSQYSCFITANSSWAQIHYTSPQLCIYATKPLEGKQNLGVAHRRMFQSKNTSYSLQQKPEPCRYRRCPAELIQMRQEKREALACLCAHSPSMCPRKAGLELGGRCTHM